MYHLEIFSDKIYNCADLRVNSSAHSAQRFRPESVPDIPYCSRNLSYAPAASTFPEAPRSPPSWYPFWQTAQAKTVPAYPAGASSPKFPLSNRSLQVLNGRNLQIKSVFFMPSRPCCSLIFCRLSLFYSKKYCRYSLRLLPHIKRLCFTFDGFVVPNRIVVSPFSLRM